MILALALAAAFQAQTPPPPARPNPRNQTVVRDSTTDTTKNRQAGRRLPVTAAVIASAFKDASTRALFEKARQARVRQDSSIRSYDAIARQRMSVDLGIGSLGREHLFWRQEVAARVQWQHDVGAWIDLTGARVGIPMAPKEAEIDNLLSDMNRMSPIPYYPGYESLWIGGDGSARVEANDRDIVNPLANGAEAYYTYGRGDSISFTLPNGTTIRLQEIEVRPRSPKWNLAVGSLWFDVNGQLVKGVYRLSVPLDMWTMIEEQEQDSTEHVPAIVRGLVSPLRAQITGVAVEYALMHGQYWLPRMRSMTGNAQILFAKVPMSIDQRFEYRSVNGPGSLAKIDTTRLPPLSFNRPDPARRDSLRRADSARRALMTPAQRLAEADSLRRRRDSVNAAQNARAKARNAHMRAVADSIDRGLPATGATLSARAGAECDSTGIRTAYLRRFEARMPVAVRIPCDLNKLIKSPDLPPSIYDSGEELFSTRQRDEMMAQALSLADQAPLSLFALPRPSYSFGLPMTRFNRVEGLSTGISVNQELGAGLSVGAAARFGLADRIPNLELTGARTNLTKTIRVTGYHHLVSASDWGNPLSFGSSFSALIFGKDEGFYYRATGAEATWSRGVNSKVEWRLFGDKQQTAGVHTQAALVHRSSTDTFPSNLTATAGTFLGSGLRLVHNHGLDPRAFRTFTDVRLEAAKGDSLYGRAAAELTMSTGLPRKLAVGLTLSAGTSAGALPRQRWWYLGGPHTVRGQSASVAQSGNAYWLTRLDLGIDRQGYRPSLFADLGWVGDRSRIAEIGRPLSGVGYGASAFDGIFRYDIAYGLHPRRQWRFDVYLEAKF
jgi:hypothetical protein